MFEQFEIVAATPNDRTHARTTALLDLDIHFGTGALSLAGSLAITAALDAQSRQLLGGDLEVLPAGRVARQLPDDLLQRRAVQHPPGRDRAHRAGVQMQCAGGVGGVEGDELGEGAPVGEAGLLLVGADLRVAGGAPRAAPAPADEGHGHPVADVPGPDRLVCRRRLPDVAGSRRGFPQGKCARDACDRIMAGFRRIDPGGRFG